MLCLFLVNQKWINSTVILQSSNKVEEGKSLEDDTRNGKRLQTELETSQWENHGEQWENGGLMGFYGMYPLVIERNYGKIHHF